MDKQFAKFLHDFVKKYKTDIFSDFSKCKSLLLDHAKGEFKKEIRLLLQALELGCHTIILSSNDLNLTRMALIRQFQNEYFISEEISSALIDMLLLELRSYKIISENPPAKTPSSITKRNKPKSNISLHNSQRPNNTVSNIDKSAIREIGSIISSKENHEKQSIENFLQKIKSVYEPAFIAYQKVMNENNLKCNYEIRYPNFLSKSYIISFTFLFVSSLRNNNLHPKYYISKGVDDYVLTHESTVDDLNSADSNLSLSPSRKYRLEELTKEMIVNDLTKITETTPEFKLQVQRKPDKVF